VNSINPTAEGYVTPTANGYRYVYNYVDNLGSIRLSYTDADGNGTISQSEIIEENNYRPFGLKMRGFNTSISSLGNSVAQHYKYNGKELSEEFGLNTYDFGARNYNPDLGRWMNLDPLADNYANITPFAFVVNMPLVAIDPDGKRIIIIGNEAYRNKVIFELAKLASTEEGSKQFLELSESDDDIIIAMFSEVDGKDNKLIGSQRKEGSKNYNHFIRFNVFRKGKVGGVPRDGSASLSHEFGHIQDVFAGTTNNWLAATDESYNDPEGPFRTKIEELGVMHKENLVRAALGLKLRDNHNHVKTLDMEVGKQKYFESGDYKEYLFELVPKAENMHFDYSSVPKADTSRKSSVWKILTWSNATNLTEWNVQRKKLTKFSKLHKIKYDDKDQATIIKK
jgi:RHS repeat-associated protein